VEKASAVGEGQSLAKDNLDVFVLRWMTCLIKKDTPFC
jgi:hypothetical protein